MPDDPILQMLGLARKAGRLETGEEPVGAACRGRKARLVLTAADAAPNTLRRADHFCQAGAVPRLSLPFSKLELGQRLSRGPCAILALTDAGFAASVAGKLAARDPACAPAAEELRLRADRALERQREQRRHEKNLREGKRHPWAPPPAPPKPAGPKPPGGVRPKGRKTFLKSSRRGPSRPV